jgi:hypothetical protein
MGTHGIVLTYKDYEALPSDGRRYELHEGELSMTPPPGTRHQRILILPSAQRSRRRIV